MLTANRSNGRKTTYQLNVNQYGKRTGTVNEPVRETDKTSPFNGQNQSGKRTLTVKNRKEPSYTYRKERTIPENFCITDEVENWAKQKGHTNLEGHFENFVDQCEAKGYKYKNWNAAFKTAIRKDWAGLNVGIEADPMAGGI